MSDTRMNELHYIADVTGRHLRQCRYIETENHLRFVIGRRIA